MRKSGNKWQTNCCGRCEESHTGYSGKLDAHGIEYVVCGKTNKRMNIHGPTLYYTDWVQMYLRIRILKLRFYQWCGFKLTSDERSDLAFWITRKVTKSNEETLREVNGERDGKAV